MFDKSEYSDIHIPLHLEEFLGPQNTEYYKKLNNPNGWCNIPLLNYTPIHLLKDNTLVRFKGMIQDMQDPEIYLEQYEVKRIDGPSTRLQNGRYRDCVLVNKDEEVVYNSKSNIHGERRTLFVVSIPGINDWVREYEESCNSHNLPTICAEESVGTAGVKKRPVTKDQTMDTDCVNDQEVLSMEKPGKSKRQKTECNVQQSNNAALNAEYLLNSPIPERPSKACMIKIYKDFDSYTLNTVIDAVGYLSVDPSLDGSIMEIDQLEKKTEIQAQNPPPSLIPRLHAIAVHNLPHANPLLDKRISADVNDIENINMEHVQKDLRTLLTLCLFNDDLAADYLLSNLISTVYSRTELESIGKFSLNICNIPSGVTPEYTKKLYKILELIIPASHYLPMTLDIMNTSSFSPKKDYETNKLVSGLLQLSPHTHLVLDETQMQQGKLEANGVLGIQSISYLINNQQIKCNFQYYDIDYDVDIPVLLLSEGRSMLQSDISLPLKTDSDSVSLILETLTAANHYIKQNSRLDQFRRYLTLAKTATYAVNHNDVDMIQSDFVEMRKADSATNADNLHSLLVLSRLLAIASGKHILDNESWSKAKEMEAKRRDRLNNLPKLASHSR